MPWPLAAIATVLGLLQLPATSAVHLTRDLAGFTGDWELVAPEHPPRDMPLTLGVNALPDADAALLFVHRRATQGEADDSYRIEPYTTSSRSGFSWTGTRLERTMTSSVKWSGQSLMFSERRRSSESDWPEHDEVWTLDSEGRLQVVATTRLAGAEPATSTRVYRRRAPVSWSGHIVGCARFRSSGGIGNSGVASPTGHSLLYTRRIRGEMHRAAWCVTR